MTVDLARWPMNCHIISCLSSWAVTSADAPGLANQILLLSFLLMSHQCPVTPSCPGLAASSFIKGLILNSNHEPLLVTVAEPLQWKIGNGLTVFLPTPPLSEGRLLRYYRTSWVVKNQPIRKKDYLFRCPYFFKFNWFKGIVRRKLMWVKNGINQ
jgi:hypothetical protein